MIRLGLIGLGQAAQILHIPNIEKMETIFYKGIMPSETGFRFSSGL